MQQHHILINNLSLLNSGIINTKTYKSDIYFVGKRKQPCPEIIKEQNIVICTSLDFSWIYHNTWFDIKTIVLRMLNLQ